MRFRRAPQTAWRTIAGETILLDLAAKRMYGLNPTAAFVWQALEAVEDVGDLLDALRGRGEGEVLGVEELQAFLDEMVELKLIQEAEPGNRPHATVNPPETVEVPRIVWRETVEQVAASCAFFPAQNPLCNQVPMS